MFSLRNLIVIALFLTLTGCARTYQARQFELAGFRNNYSLFKEGSDEEVLLTYWNKGINWQAYKKVILEPVIVKTTKRSVLYSMTHAEGYRLSELLGYYLQEALKTHFKLVSKPAPDTLRVEYVITDVATADAVQNMFASAYSSPQAVSGQRHPALAQGPFIGKASIEGKVTDSTTGELLLATVDDRVVDKSLLGFSNPWDSGEGAYKFWALQLNYQLCLRQARQHYCLKPDLERDGWYRF